jgi:hypothetical protein
MSEYFTGKVVTMQGGRYFVAAFAVDDTVSVQ